MKVALVQCPVWWTVDPPLGFAQIAGCDGHSRPEPAVFDLNIRLAKKHLPAYENHVECGSSSISGTTPAWSPVFSATTPPDRGGILRILRSDAPVIGFSVYSGATWRAWNWPAHQGRKPLAARRFRRADLFLQRYAREMHPGPGHGRHGQRARGLRVPEDALGIRPIRGASRYCPGSAAGRTGGSFRGAAAAAEGFRHSTVRGYPGFPLELIFAFKSALPFAGQPWVRLEVPFLQPTHFWSGYSPT